MHLIQLLLPLHDNAGQPFSHAYFEEVRSEMTKRFGGVTAYVRSPAEGAFEDASGDVLRDDIVIVEVMCETLDRVWWAAYREHLTQHFEQQELVIRALPFERL
jgi:hypothetical protein